MKKGRKDKDFIKKPTYQGGQKALNAFIYKHLQFPKEAIAANIEGSVFLRYSIDIKGKVVDAQVISKLGYGCDEEALRVVRLLRFEVDKVFRARVLFHKKIRVWFKKPKSPKKQGNATQLNYQLKPSKASEKSSSGSFNYTITIK